MIQSGAKFRIFKALQMRSRKPKALALGSVNCVNFGKKLSESYHRIRSVICVNFETTNMQRQTAL